MEPFELLSSDDDTNDKPRAKKNINSVAGMMINIKDNEEYEQDDEFNDGDVGNYHYESESEEEEEAGDKNEAGEGKRQ